MAKDKVNTFEVSRKADPIFGSFWVPALPKLCQKMPLSTILSTTDKNDGRT